MEVLVGKVFPSLSPGRTSLPNSLVLLLFGCFWGVRTYCLLNSGHGVLCWASWGHPAPQRPCLLAAPACIEAGKRLGQLQKLLLVFSLAQSRCNKAAVQCSCSQQSHSFTPCRGCWTSASRWISGGNPGRTSQGCGSRRGAVGEVVMNEIYY